MTKTSAERITGLTVTVVEHTGGFEAQAWDGAELVAVDHDRKEKEALRLLVEKVYRQRSREILEKQEGRCGRCGRVGLPLQIHHKVHRSMGRRRDSVDNLKALCLECHRLEHGG